MCKTVVLIRHGETDWNAEQRWQGHCDVPLNQTGVAQAKKLSDDLRCFELEVLLSSDLARAHETAQIIAQRLRIQVFNTRQLREVNVGAAEGLGYQEVILRFGMIAIERWRSIQSEDLSFAFDGGETKLEAVRRAEAAVGSFLAKTSAKCVGIVSHGMLIRTLVHYLIPELEEALPVKNCAYYVLSYDPFLPGWELVGGSVSTGNDFVFRDGNFESSEAF